MGFPGNPVYLEGVFGNLFPHVLQSGAGQREEVLLEYPFQRPMVRVDGEFWETVEIEGALGDCRNNCEALQLYGGVALLGRGEAFRPTVHDFKVFRTRRVDVDMP